MVMTFLDLIAEARSTTPLHFFSFLLPTHEEDRGATLIFVNGIFEEKNVTLEVSFMRQRWCVCVVVVYVCGVCVVVCAVLA